MEPIEIIGSLQKALIRLDGADEFLAATKVAEAIEILKMDCENKSILQKTMHHDND